MKLAYFPRKTTEVARVVVSALHRGRPTEFSAVKISQILRCSRLLVRDPGYNLDTADRKTYKKGSGAQNFPSTIVMMSEFPVP